MKLGIYKPPSPGAETNTYERVALYDFETSEWDDTSDGVIVAKASESPSPEELKVRFDMDSRHTIVRTPTALEDENVEIGDAELSVAEGHQRREDNGGPPDTQTQREYQRDQAVVVLSDDHEITDEDREWHEERGETIVHESDYDGLDFSEEFDFGFETSDE